MKLRRLPTPDEEWPRPPDSNEPEVTLFNIPGPRPADAGVVDVNSASRLDIRTKPIAAPAPAGAGPTEVAAAPGAGPSVDDLALAGDTRTASGAIFLDLDLAAQGRPPALLVGDSLEAFPSETPALPAAPPPPPAPGRRPSSSLAPRPQPAPPSPRTQAPSSRPPVSQRPAPAARPERASRPLPSAPLPEAARPSRLRAVVLVGLAATAALIATGAPRIVPSASVESIRAMLEPADRPPEAVLRPPPTPQGSPAVGTASPAAAGPAEARDTGPPVPTQPLDGRAGRATDEPPTAGTVGAADDAPSRAESPVAAPYGSASGASGAANRAAAGTPRPRVEAPPLAATPPVRAAASADAAPGPGAAPRPVSVEPATPSGSTAAAAAVPAPPPVAAPPVAAPPPAERASDPTPADAPRAVGSRADTPRTEPVPADAGAVVTPEAPVAAPPVTTREATASEGMAAALKRLQVAYARRDAALVKAVWPAVDERALARAFEGLRSQSVSFDRCETRIASGEAGELECRGVTTYVPRVGGQYQRTESRQWRFRMEKNGESWVINSAASR